MANENTRRTPAQVIHGLQDGLECLLELAAMERPVGSRELARKLGQSYTRVNRLLGTLTHMGLADQTANRKYIPGPGLHILAALSLRGSHLLDCSMPYVRKLGEETGMRVALGMRWRTHVCYLYHGLTSAGQMSPAIASHDLYPADQSSIGVMLLSELDDDQILQLFNASGSSVTTTPNAKVLQENVEQARRQGYSVASNKGSVAVPVGSPVIAGLALVTASGKRLTKRESVVLSKKLHQAADAIDKAMARRVG